MLVLAHDQRPIGRRMLRIGDDGLDRRIHRSHDVRLPVAGMPVRIDRALVVQGTVRIVAARPACGGVVIGSAAAFIAERPDDHARVVLVPQDHPGDPVDEGAQVPRVVADASGPVMGFDIGFIDDVKTEAVGQLEEHRIIRIMRGADGIDVETLELGQLLVQLFPVQGPTGMRVEVVPVDALNPDPLPVDQQIPATDHYPAEADVDPGFIGQPAFGIDQLYQ